MSTEQQQPVTPPSTKDTWGSSGGPEWSDQQPKRKWSPKKLALAVAIAVGIAGAGTVAVYAASGSSSSSQQGPGGGTGGPGGGTGGPGGLTSQAPPGQNGATQNGADSSGGN